MTTAWPDSGTIEVTLAFAPAPRQVLQCTLHLPAGSTVAAALQASRLAERLAEVEQGALVVGVWGRACRLDHVLRADDRLELYRPLRVDPKLARRERFQKQGARTAGLFSQRRAGAKPGY